MHDVSGLIIGGKFYKCGIIDRLPNNLPQTYPVGTIDPTVINKNLQEKLYQVTAIAAKTLGINFGPVKSDIILDTNKVPYVIEVAPRFHGNITTVMTTPLGSGINPIKAYFYYMATGKINQKFLKPKSSRYSGFKIITAPEGVIRKINGLGNFKSVGGSGLIFLRKHQGDKIEYFRDTGDMIGYVVCQAKTVKKLLQKLDAALSTTKIEVHNN